MNWKFLNQPLGVANPIGTPKKEIAWFVPLIMAAASAATSAYGANKSAQANRRAENRLLGEKNQTEAERLRAKYQKWGDTASGQNTMRLISDQANRELSRIQGAAAVGGATDAAVANEKEQLRERQAEVIAEANANFEDKKDAVDAGYRQQISGLNQQLVGVDQAKGQAAAQAAASISNALIQGAVGAAGSMGTGSPGGGGVVAPSKGSTLQDMGGNAPAAGPVQIPAIGNEMFAHNFGKLPYNTDYLNTVINAANGIKWPKLGN